MDAIKKLKQPRPKGKQKKRLSTKARPKISKSRGLNLTQAYQTKSFQPGSAILDQGRQVRTRSLGLLLDLESTCPSSEDSFSKDSEDRVLRAMDAGLEKSVLCAKGGSLNGTSQLQKSGEISTTPSSPLKSKNYPDNSEESVEVTPEVIAHILNSLAAMEDKMNKLDTLDSIVSLNISLKGDMSKVQTKVETINEQMAHLTSELKDQEIKWEERTSKLSDRISQLETNNTKLINSGEQSKEEIQALKNVVHNNADSNSTSLTELLKRVQASEDRLSVLEKLEEKVIQAEKQTATFKAKLEALEHLEGHIKEAAEEKSKCLRWR